MNHPLPADPRIDLSVPRLRPVAGAGVGVQLLVVGLLWAAAGAKGYQLWRQPVGDWRGLLVLAVLAEWLLGMWIVLGGADRLRRVVVPGVFGAFGVYALYRWVAGEASCGCFGFVTVHPAVMLVVDMAVVALWGAAVRGGRAMKCGRRASIGLASVGVGIGLAATVALAGSWHVYLEDEGQAFKPGQLIVLEPEDWVGKRLPLERYVVGWGEPRVRAATLPGVLPGALPGEVLGDGHWELMLYQSGCTDCREALSQWTSAPRDDALRRGVIHVAGEAPAPAAEGVDGIWSLSKDYRWFAQAPVWIEVEDGIVVGVRRSAGEVGGSSVDVARGRAMPAGGVDIVAEGQTADLGYIQPGSSHRIAFRIENPKGQAMAIREIKSECACAVPTSYPQEIEPGGWGRIIVDFEASDQVLLYSKRLVVETGDPDQRRVLTISARVGLPLLLEPSTVDFGRIAVGDSIEKRVVFVNESDRPVRLIFARSHDAGLRLSVPADAVEPGDRLELPVSLEVSDLPPARYRRIIDIRTDHPDQSTCQLEISYEVSR